MAQENDQEAAVAEDQELENESQDLDTDLPDDTDWKAEAAKARRIASRYRNQAIKLKEAKKETPAAKEPESKTEPAKSGLDYAVKGFLNSNGIKGKQEMELAEQWIKRTGDTPEDMLEDDIFQGKLKKIRDNNAAKEGTPSSTKRPAGNAAQDSVEYWVAKGELPPMSNMTLRRKVVNAKIAAAKKGPFYNS